jgi:hypothetical protein
VHAAKTTAFISVRLYAVALFILPFCLMRPAVAAADVLSGFMEWDYNHISSDTHDATGTSTSNKGDIFNQKYSLMLNKSFYPQLTLRAGYLWETDQSWLTINDVDSHASVTTSLPSFDLFVGNPMLNAAVGYNRRKETDIMSGTPSLDRYNEDYHASLGWRPEGLPWLSLVLSRINTFDGLRTTQNTSDDRATFGLLYSPIKGLDLKYLFTYDDLTDKLVGLDVEQTTHTGRVNYSGQFFHERVSVYSTYTFSQQDTTTTTAGQGVVDLQITPFAGLFALSDIPTFVTLDPFPALIDGNVGTSAGIDIGPMLPPLVPRNMGLDFLDPLTTVNRLLVWVNVKVPITTVNVTRLPDRIAQLYTWDIYTSQDNAHWTKFFSTTGLVMDPFQNRFEIRFPSVQTRYIKVVVSPLDQNAVQALSIPGFQPPFNVFVTELQAFNEVPAASVQGKTSTTSHNLNSDIKVYLLDDSTYLPALAYDCSIFFTSSSPSGFTKWVLDNALLADHRFNEYVSASGRFTREDSDEPLGHREAYVYNATLRYIPLKTLTHTLAYSGRTESFQGRTSDSNSVYLNNTAQLYKGVDVNASGGVSSATSETGEKNTTYSFLLSINVVPRRDLSFNINYTYNKSDLSGGGQPSSTISTKRGDFSVTYRPFTTLYLLASFAVLEQTDKPTNVFQNYGVNWSPFPDGALQFNFSYSENIQTLNQEKSRLITPSLTWKITERTILDVSYPFLKTESISGTTDSQTLSAILRTSF